MPDRYYSAAEITGTSTTLDGTEAHHLLHVMRAKPGLEAIVFDGRGGEFPATVANCTRITVELTLGERQKLERELPFPLTLAVSQPKGDRQRWLIEKAVELGVTRMVPLQTERTIGKPEKPTKLARYVIEASKQCGRNRLMEITQPVAWPQLLTESTGGPRLLAHPGGRPLTEVVTQTTAIDEVLLAIGPEGGFTEDEAAQAIDAGWQWVGLGARILRIETAAAALVAALTLGNRSG